MPGVRRYRIFLLVAALAAASVYYLANRRNLGPRIANVRHGDGSHRSIFDQGFNKIPGLKKPPGTPVEFPHESTPILGTAIETDSPPARYNPILPPTTTTNIEDEKVPSIDQEPISGQARKEQSNPEVAKPAKGIELTDQSNSRWRKYKEHNPISKEDLINLPTGQPKPLRKVQFDFEAESVIAREERLKKQTIIRKSFDHAWSGYKKYAQPHDELKPLSKEGIDRKQFMGWGATLVDTLDTLWIMGMYDEFEDAVNQVAKIDFKQSEHDRISMFEITIRYLGGLLSAYDLSSKKYPILLEKATDLGEVLIGAFDTPNRMPIPYYYPADANKPHRSANNTVLAEIGSMSMEFTRLAQLTGQSKYYDAIARVTNALQEWQMKTKMPGLWPLHLDSSGCKRVEKRKPDSGTVQKDKDTAVKSGKSNTGTHLLDGEEPAVLPNKVGGGSNDHTKRQTDDDFECEPQGLQPEPFWGMQFGIGGQADSVYEYMPKMYSLLGGLSTQYRTMYEAAMKAIRTDLLYRPMIEDAKRNVLFASKHEIEQQQTRSGKQSKIHYEGTHLTCFAGGMVALGSKLFDIPSDMDIAKRLADGCVWAYESMPSGIMAEDFELAPCDSEVSCPWSEKKWHRTLDPDEQERIDAVELWNENQKAMYGAEGTPATEVVDDLMIQTAPNKPGATMFKGGIKDGQDSSHMRRDKVQDPEAPTKTSSSIAEDEQTSPTPVSFKAMVALPHEKFVQKKIQEEMLFPGYTKFSNPSYILRPEAIESVFIMWRTTGDDYWRQKGWKMFQSVEAATQTEAGNAALRDVRSVLDQKTDSMESFWLAETLKYYYLLFSEPELISLDDYVLNTEAHPFKLSKPTS